MKYMEIRLNVPTFFQFSEAKLQERLFPENKVILNFFSIDFVVQFSQFTDHDKRTLSYNTQIFVGKCDTGNVLFEFNDPKTT